MSDFLSSPRFSLLVQVPSKSEQVHNAFERRRSTVAGNTALNGTTSTSRLGLLAAAAPGAQFRTPRPLSGKHLRGPASYTPVPGRSQAATAAATQPPAGAGTLGDLFYPLQTSMQQQQQQQRPNILEQQQQEQRLLSRPRSRGGTAPAGDAAAGGRPSPLLLARDALDNVDPIVTAAGSKKLQATDGKAALLDRRTNASMDRWKHVRS